VHSGGPYHNAAAAIKQSQHSVAPGAQPKVTFSKRAGDSVDKLPAQRPQLYDYREEGLAHDDRHGYGYALHTGGDYVVPAQLHDPQHVGSGTHSRAKGSPAGALAADGAMPRRTSLADFLSPEPYFNVESPRGGPAISVSVPVTPDAVNMALPSASLSSDRAIIEAAAGTGGNDVAAAISPVRAAAVHLQGATARLMAFVRNRRDNSKSVSMPSHTAGQHPASDASNPTRSAALNVPILHHHPRMAGPTMTDSPAGSGSEDSEADRYRHTTAVVVEDDADAYADEDSDDGDTVLANSVGPDGLHRDHVIADSFGARVRARLRSQRRSDFVPNPNINVEVVGPAPASPPSERSPSPAAAATAQ